MKNMDMIAECCKEIEQLKKMPIFSNEFKIWKNRTKRCIIENYGEDSIEYKQFTKIHYSPLIRYGNDADQCRLKFYEGLEVAKGLLNDLVAKESNNQNDNDNILSLHNNKIFIVHGHDNQLKSEVARLVEKQGIEAVILHEQVNDSKTIIEKIEHYGRTVSAAIILYTPDDVGKCVNDKDLSFRARQNVIFEAGYFAGFLGRNRLVHIVSDKSIELPGDLSGVVYSCDEWRIDVLKELRAKGFKIDMNIL